MRVTLDGDIVGVDVVEMRRVGDRLGYGTVARARRLRETGHYDPTNGTFRVNCAGNFDQFGDGRIFARR